MSLDKKIIGLGPAPRCGVTGFDSTIETGSMTKNTSGSTIAGMAYGESSGTGYMAIANDTIYIYNADGSSLGSKAINIGYATQGLIYHDNKFWALTNSSNGWRSYTIASSPTETLVGPKAAMVNWLCDDPNDSSRYFCGYRSDSNVYTISKSNFLDDTPTLLFSGKIDYTTYGWDGVGSVTSDGDYIWVMAYNPSGNTTTIFQYDPKTWDRYTDSDYTTTAIGGSNYIGNMVYNRSNNRMWHVRAYSNSANKYVPIVGPTCPTPSTYTVDFLVVAGGGGSGNDAGGGGGARGLRTSYGSTSGGGGSAESSTTLTVGSVYSAIIGGGGSGVAVNGTNSSFSYISSVGGGAGRGYNKTGNDGGSGGGGNRFSGASGGSGTTNQGYGGGNGADLGGGGGGGGASAAGTNAVSNATHFLRYGGNGGDGVAVSITGSSTYYAGGGGGQKWYTTGNGGSGGQGGGAGNGNGTANTGGGAGGEDNAGGSGVVIIRVATSNYTGTTTGSPTITTDGSDTIIKFTGSGTYTA